MLLFPNQITEPTGVTKNYIVHNRFVDKCIENNIDLMKQIHSESLRAGLLYQPGSYWRTKTRNAVSEIKSKGLVDFRGFHNGAAASFGDNPSVDFRDQINSSIRNILFGRFIDLIKPFRMAFDEASGLAQIQFEVGLAYKNQFRLNDDKIVDLIYKYKHLETLLGNPVDVITTQDNFQFSNHYLDLIYSQQNFDDYARFNEAHCFMEIGGGFGANVHILVERFPNIKKILYVDISPNLYVAIQYLKAFYGKSVRYVSPSDTSRIEFSKTDELEIICILPSSIEFTRASVDIFWNAHSFVEMPKEVVANYVRHVLRLQSKKGMRICLLSYEYFDSNTTFDPRSLSDFFEIDFVVSSVSTLSPTRNIHLCAHTFANP